MKKTSLRAGALSVMLAVTIPCFFRSKRGHSNPIGVAPLFCQKSIKFYKIIWYSISKEPFSSIANALGGRWRRKSRKGIVQTGRLKASIPPAWYAEAHGIYRTGACPDIPCTTS